VKDIQSVEHTFWGEENPIFTTRIINESGKTKTMKSEEEADETSTEIDELSTITRAAASSTSTSNDNEDKKSSVPLGAIIGGAVGGVALIGAIMLGIFFMLRRKKNKTAPAPTDGPINPPTMSFAPQNANPMMLDSKMVGSPNEHRASTVSPLGSPGWGGPVSPPPVYEAPAHEAVQVHEMGDSSVTR